MNAPALFSPSVDDLEAQPVYAVLVFSAVGVFINQVVAVVVFTIAGVGGPPRVDLGVVVVAVVAVVRVDDPGRLAESLGVTRAKAVAIMVSPEHDSTGVFAADGTLALADVPAAITTG
jgi:hypothetical protein